MKEELERNPEGELISHELETGTPLKTENRLGKYELDTMNLKTKIRIETFYSILDLIKLGLSKSEVKHVVIRQNKKVTDTIFEDLFITALRFYSDQFVTEWKPVIAIHLDRYRKMIQEMEDYDYESVHPKVRFKVMVGHKLTILETLYSIEKLLQLHRKDVNIKITQKNNTVVVKKDETVNDITRLTLTEKMRLIKLLEKSKRSDDEIFLTESRLVTNPEAIQGKVEDIEHEEIVTNVEVMKDIKDKEEDLSNVVPPKIRLVDLEDSLMRKFREIAEKQLREKGSKL